jgi:hypothetical protein
VRNGKHAWAFALLALLVACEEAEAVPPPGPPPIDRTPAGPPESLRVELRMDGGDATLRAFLERLPASDVRDRFPPDLESLVDALVALPPAISGHVAPGSPLRVIMAEVDGVPRSALALRLADRPDAPSLHEGGPRGALLVDETTAIVDDIAIVADDPAMLERALPYLAFTAIVEHAPEGAIVLRVPAETLRGSVREALERVLTSQADSLRASARDAMRAHATPPTLGDPEALVGLVERAVRARLGYLPDLGEGTVTIAPSPSGLSISFAASITAGSPLAEALADRVPVDEALVLADEEAALVLATGVTDAAQDRDARALVDDLAELAGERLASAEREQLALAMTSLAHARGPMSALAIGATETTGAFLSLVTRGAPADAALPTPWGRRGPWISEAIGTLAGCDPSEPRAGADVTICGARSLSTRSHDGQLVAAIGTAAGARADETLAHLTAAASPSSPDLTRDLSALPDAPFVILLARPLRALPLIVALGGPPREGLPRGDGAMLLALANDHGTLRAELRASTAALADLGVVMRLFAE